MAALTRSPGGPRPAGAPAENNVYTMLLMIAAAFLLVAVVVLGIQFHSFYGLDQVFSGVSAVGR